jgi:RNA recognition motif-containing protein
MVDAVYVGNLNEGTTEDELKLLFAPYGPLISVKIMYDRVSAKSLCFGFIKLQDKKAMKLAVKELKSVELNGNKLNVSSAIERK